MRFEDLQSFIFLQVPWAQEVGPVKPLPPHWPYRAAAPTEPPAAGVAAGRAEVTRVVGAGAGASSASHSSSSSSAASASHSSSSAAAAASVVVPVGLRITYEPWLARSGPVK